MKGSVSFPTRSRIHMGLRVRDLGVSLEFYAKLFGQPPTKERPGYAKFEVLEPPVNLTLNEDPEYAPSKGNVNHFGIQVQSTEAVQEAGMRLHAAGLEPRAEEGTSCCHAIQDKAWVTDPDGNAWEFFVVLADVEQGPSSCCS